MPRAKRNTRKPRDYSYKPPKLLDAPDPPENMHYRFIRVETHGETDASNYARRRRQGYEPVKASELPEGFHAPTMEHGKFDGYVGVQGLVLCKIPVEKAQEIQDYAEAKAARMDEAVRNHWMSDQNPNMPKSHDERVNVTKGKPLDE